ncbi:hypothetical protein ACFY2R_00350 [Micromonospora olivasterospora]|uniref:Uncharacterized protein n=1 Tax=Micromonospora olivasterospora TaxID=1880 RepID=A0A562I9H5_MICOL|nr:hypothetical protein [Micromonospora olivasterospora]TWH67657.1 hypothetical protein JD77_02637 [Micromonospora olivasterospora]
MSRQALLRTTVVALAVVLVASRCGGSGGKKSRKSGAKTSAAEGSDYVGKSTVGGTTGSGRAAMSPTWR